MKLGIFGGTFDPVHIGHLRLAIEAKEQLGLDEVVLEVAAASPFKLDAKSAPHEIRCRMVELAIEGMAGFRLGQAAASKTAPSYSIDLLKEYEEAQNELHFIIGADALAGFPKWKDPDDVARLAKIAAGRRPGADLHDVLASMPQFANRIEVFNTPFLEISATDIRRRVSMGQDIRHLTPWRVVELITRDRIYAANP